MVSNQTLIFTSLKMPVKVTSFLHTQGIGWTRSSLHFCTSGFHWLHRLYDLDTLHLTEFLLRNIRAHMASALGHFIYTLYSFSIANIIQSAELLFHNSTLITRFDKLPISYWLYSILYFWKLTLDIPMLQTLVSFIWVHGVNIFYMHKSIILSDILTSTFNLSPRFII